MRNLQFMFILYTTIVTVLVDLNIAVISGTIMFYVARRFWAMKDVEADLSEPAPEDDSSAEPEIIEDRQKEEVLISK